MYDPSTMMLLAVCQTQSHVHKARILTRAVRSMMNEVSCHLPLGSAEHPMTEVPDVFVTTHYHKMTLPSALQTCSKLVARLR